MIKNFLLLFPLIFPSLIYSQSICDSVYISPNIVYLNQLEDTAAYVELTFTGESDISYSFISFIFPDSNYIDINEFAITNGVSGPFTYVPFGGYPIIYNNPNIPSNTIVNAQMHIYHGGKPSPTIDCYMPVTFIINSTTGINESHNNVQFQLFPNPVNNFLFIEGGISGVELSIYDLVGRKVLGRTLTSSSSFIDIAKFSEGIYIVVMKNNNISMTRKILKLK